MTKRLDVMIHQGSHFFPTVFRVAKGLGFFFEEEVSLSLYAHIIKLSSLMDSKSLSAFWSGIERKIV